MREMNPAYGEALDAYGGTIAGRGALLKGRESLKDGADDLANVTAGMTPFEADNFALGNRSAIANDLSDFGRKTPYGNAAARLRQNFGQEGTDTYQAMQGIHGADEVNGLAKVADWEHQAAQTFQAVRGNSLTAERLSDLSDQDQKIEEAGAGLLQVLAGRPGAGAWNIAKAVGRGERNGPEIKGHMAEVLAEQDPEALRSAMRAIEAEQARRALVDQRTSAATLRAGRVAGGVLGSNIIGTVEDEEPAY